ncbi:hypothetical protein PV10_04738 [Exophiala mesophila]|uniref:UV radiation resistance-associated gene protein n=1 Tax=Exophiala mesophila TaxID=212818 RepID=A0A0D2A3I1_EXOME|nr:uncharacterized protein PV10_04738 [Exophiala mesophila]KIV93528.1 hypothetical protein PV10_04738 [Exophiala mesophila]
MSEHGHPSTNLPVASQHERPFLYSWNRRLRHLHGVSLRNLHITSNHSRTRGKTVTDDDAPLNLVSPAKRALQNDVYHLQHARSFSDLTASLEKQPSPLSRTKASTSYEKNDGSPKRRPEGRLRRRSTLHWTSASPRDRQSKLEDMVLNRLADTWISVHSSAAEEPIYITEVVERSMNPTYAYFDLDGCDPVASRSDACVIRVWATPSTTDEYSLLVELDVNFRSLHYIGKNLETFHHPLPQNCVLLHLSDGIYTSFTDLPASSLSGFIPYSDVSDQSATKTTSSFDALMQLANLDDCIRDAINVRTQLENDINASLDGNSRASSLDDAADLTDDDDGPQARTALAAEQKHLRQLSKRKHELEDSLNHRRDALREGHQFEAQIQAVCHERVKSCTEVEAQVKEMEKKSVGQMRRICEGLLSIFPIEPIKNRPLQFTMRGIHLPNSVYNDTNRDEIAAALGFTAQMVLQLSLYLSVPLPYPLEAYGSASYISDPISVALSQRRFPLHPTNVPYKFEYGVFLLNKDIEFLMSRSGLRVLDIRHTLPNLKYLMYVLTAGTGELPARKAGGIRALGGRPTPDISRRTSEDSVRSLPELKKASIDLRTHAGMLSKEKREESDLADPFLTSTPAQGLPFRSRLPFHTG